MQNKHEVCSKTLQTAVLAVSASNKIILVQCIRIILYWLKSGSSSNLERLTTGFSWLPDVLRSTGSPCIVEHSMFHQRSGLSIEVGSRFRWVPHLCRVKIDKAKRLLKRNSFRIWAYIYLFVWFASENITEYSEADLAVKMFSVKQTVYNHLL